MIIEIKVQTRFSTSQNTRPCVFTVGCLYLILWTYCYCGICLHSDGLNVCLHAFITVLKTDARNTKEGPDFSMGISAVRSCIFCPRKCLDSGLFLTFAIWHTRFIYRVFTREITFKVMALHFHFIYVLPGMFVIFWIALFNQGCYYLNQPKWRKTTQNHMGNKKIKK